MPAISRITWSRSGPTLGSPCSATAGPSWPAARSAVARTAVALGAALATALWAGPAHGDARTTLGSYSVATQAPVWQFTYDFPTANFHPQADGELTYATANMDTTRAHALSS